jgi:tetratricopeptide (TPR) repeat protein
MEINTTFQSALMHFQSGNLDEALAVCRQLLKTEPDNSEALHLSGLIFFQLGDTDSALKNLRKALKFAPDNADTFFDLGNVLQEKGELTKAVTNYKKAIKLNPDYAEAYNNMGIALQDNSRTDKAIKSYREALRISPDYADAHNNIGVAFQEKKQLDQAITHFQKALLLQPGYADAYQNLIEAVQGKGYENKYVSNKRPVYAIYRCLYGEDFVQESIKSIAGYVDKIFVFWDDAPPGNVTGCIYRGETVTFPKKFDDVVGKVRSLDNPRIEIIYAHQDTADNYLTRLVNNIILPDHEKPAILISLEADHVFRDDQIRKAIDDFIEKDCVFATTNLIEVWKGLNHRLPERPNKVGAVFCNMTKMDKMPATLKHGGVLVMPKLSAFAHSFSFAVSEKLMFWKHLLSIGAAQKLGGSIPSEDWYEEKWLKWDFESNNENLEIPEQGKEEQPLSAIPYDFNELPELIKAKHIR